MGPHHLGLTSLRKTLKTNRLDEVHGGIESNVLTWTSTSSLVLEKEIEKENPNNLERENAYFRETK